MARKSIQFNIRALAPDVKEWQRKADASGMKRGEWVRRALNIAPVFNVAPVDATRTPETKR